MNETFSPNVENFKSLHKFKNILIIFLVAVLVVFYLPRLVLSPASISVTGIGKISAIPQKVSLIVTVTNISTDPSLAINEGEESLNKLITKTKTIMGEETEIQKTFYTISLTSSQKILNGQLVTVQNYQVANGFKVTSNQVSRVNNLIKNLYAAGATSISSISFIPNDKDQVEADARKLAIANAKVEGQKIAKSMGKRLGRIQSLSDDQTEASSTVSTSQGTVGTETIDITKSMSVVYEVW